MLIKRSLVHSVLICVYLSFNKCAKCNDDGWTKWVSHTFNGAVDRVGCQLGLGDCCKSPYVDLQNGIPNLRKRLNKTFFGQHLALEIVLTSLDAHIRDTRPGKALVLSFHGWAGSGKTYLAEHIANALYREGVESKYVKFYMASLDFPDLTKVSEYRKRVQSDIRNALKRCECAMFIFDEVDKTPPKVFDAVIPFVSHPQRIVRGQNHKKAIFIFISNTGANSITSITFQAWKEGRKREDLTFTDFEDALSLESFNKAGTGLFHSGLIDRALIDKFVPFLPMERFHVLQCAKLEGEENYAEIDAEKIADSLTYWPPELKIYSQSGCRKVEAAVKYQLSLDRHNNRDDEDDNDGDEL